MSSGSWRLAWAFGFLLVVSVPAHADPILIDFESLNEFDDVGGLAGSEVTFSGATVLTAGSGLNEVDFPPHSGSNAAYDGTGPMRLDFTSQVSSFSAYFTYVVPLTLEFYDASSNLLGVVTSFFSENYATSGNPANELLSGAFDGIAYLTITGVLSGGSFVMDDVAFETMEVAPVPEPGTLLLIGTGIAALGYKRRARRRAAAL